MDEGKDYKIPHQQMVYIPGILLVGIDHSAKSLPEAAFRIEHEESANHLKKTDNNRYQIRNPSKCIMAQFFAVRVADIQVAKQCATQVANIFRRDRNKIPHDLILVAEKPEENSDKNRRCE